MIAIFVSWVALWVLKPTEFWTRKWKKAEEEASSTVFGYNGLNFVVYTFPIMALAAFGLLCMEFKQRNLTSRQQRRCTFVARLSDPLLVNSYVGVVSRLQILVSSLFIIFLIWTFYACVSNDFKKMIPVKSFKLSLWQYKLMRMATRCGLLAEACLALLLLPVLRGMSLFRVLDIQFEASVRYHIWLGNAMVFFATLHGSGTLLVWGIKHRVQDEIWKWQRKGRIYLAGEMALAIALIMWITALPPIRRNHYFRLFYYTHHLYVCFIIMFLFHGGDRHFYMVFPGVFLFALDKLLRVINSWSGTCILSAHIFPCNTIELTLPKEPRMKYMPTSVIFLKIPIISKFEWHPFSITSSSSIDENTISVVVKCEGEWTNSLHNLIRSESDLEVNQKKCIPITMEGPYGPNSLNFIRYKNMLLIAGGIGVTPFLSIIREITLDSMHAKNDYPDKIQLVYITKQSHNICLLDSVLPQLLDIKQCHIKLKVFVTRENCIGKTTLRELLVSTISKTQVMNFSTACASRATYGQEGWAQMAALVIVSSIVFVLSLVCFNYFVVPLGKKDERHSSSQIDLIFVSCFVASIACSALVTLIIRLRRRRKETRPLSETKRKSLTLNSIEVNKDYDEHEIYFRQRPDFGDVVSNFGNECEGSDIGVLVCGPESMKESVALACRGAHKDSKGKILHFNFHSLNFTL